MAIARATLPKRVVQSDFAGGGLTAIVVHSIQTSFLNERKRPTPKKRPVVS
jgi:hypothetical protein